ncbi:SDR family NAD(P)-dependent oxidoreductase [Synoicihabitans lomoniglobus]|uniref:SDR family oxidoreductase n=1 Tax=Synoicihabitans lomoniglobus TaxID=2909285 RepID=A0AAF0A1U7_9BACT|nr:SDR family oxidoreductase [Opitutaceae bacterium LMO-M01]WED65362.1 SDR family oxidoreductase [Opitutaceae bacterium LMO-M01]
MKPPSAPTFANLHRFDGKVILVTGGANGIGRAIVDELCREGATVGFADIDPAAENVANELREAGHRVRAWVGNLADESFVQSFVTEAAAHFGRLDGLVNNAFSFTAKAGDATTEDWERSFFVGPVAYGRLTAAAVPHMKSSGGGAVVNVSSISAFVAQPRRWTYNAAKGAVNTLTKCMALDYAPDGIRVNSVSPGWIWTREVLNAAALDGGGPAKWDTIWGEYHMLGRCGHPIEIARPVLFLLSADASFITGTDLPVDGGYQSMGPEGLGKTTVIAGSE